MAVEDLPFVDQVTTRRTVVKTGVKLAYAAPLIAGTMKLAGSSALALSGVGCEGADVCPGPYTCGSDNCSCHPTAEGGSFCEEDTDCGNLTACNATSECKDGWACAQNCCGQVCIGPCGTVYEQSVGGPRSNG